MTGLKNLITCFVVAFFITPSLGSASILILKSGQKLKGSIIEKTDKYIKFDSGLGVAATYYIDQIAALDGYKFQGPLKPPPLPDNQHVVLALTNNFPKTMDNNKSSQAMLSLHIHKLLNHLNYPQKTWPAIENGIDSLLKRIDYPHLKQEALESRANPLKLKNFLKKVGKLIEQEGLIDRQTPHPLIKLLTCSLVNEDISQVIFTSPISFWQKVDSKKSLVACTAISQLGSIILDLLDIKGNIAYSPAHVFNCIPINDQQVLFVDFSNQIFRLVDTNQYYYKLGSKSRLLKDQYHIPPDRLRDINDQSVDELNEDSLQEILCSLYLYIYISDDFSTTPAIYINLANIYSRKGNYEQALSYYDKAIKIDPANAEAYRERGITYGNKGELDHALSDLNKAIELFPDFAEGYHDLGSTHNTQGDFDKAIFNFNQAIIIDRNYAEAYHDRGVSYSSIGNVDQAILDFNKAIEIDPYFTEAYASRAEAYFTKQEYDRSWKDIHQIESFGEEVNPDLLEKLKKVSEIKNLFLAALIIAPILLLIFFSLS